MAEKSRENKQDVGLNYNLEIEHNLIFAKSDVEESLAYLNSVCNREADIAKQIEKEYVDFLKHHLGTLYDWLVDTQEGNLKIRDSILSSRFSFKLLGKYHFTLTCRKMESTNLIMFHVHSTYYDCDFPDTHCFPKDLRRHLEMYISYFRLVREICTQQPQAENQLEDDIPFEPDPDEEDYEDDDDEREF